MQQSSQNSLQLDVVCQSSQRASSTSFWSSCSARRASPPAPARPSSAAQPRSQSRAGSTWAHAAAGTRGTSAARNDGSTSVHGELDIQLQAPFQPARVSPAAVSRLQRWPTGAFGPHSPALGPRGRHSAPQGAENAAGERQAGHCLTTTGPVLELRRVLEKLMELMELMKLMQTLILYKIVQNRVQFTVFTCQYSL